ncbi:MAG: hypothetical protein HY096_06890 [Nitrospinae bacterium]|nr:hypothetical protein [Nitrospinota bacterium]
MEKNSKQRPPIPNTDLRNLDKLVGKWKISGDAKGQIEYKWADGGFFLIQDVNLEYGGKQIKGIEIIGHLQKIGEEPSREIWSRFYHFTEGLTLDYVYELVDNTLTIWFGKKDSNNFYSGTFNKDGNSFKGAWQWPGGGYKITGRKLPR